uniref:Protein FMC1 homolog n=1 Tax=Steinernema glaseri TaxID=37863 RepID=A0A1I8AEU0_9BILA
MLVSRIIPRTLRCARSVATATHSSVEAATPTLEQQLGALAEKILPRLSEGDKKLYSVYLDSTRQLNELQQRYKGGERSVAESANLVGLKLPEVNRE